jgi:Flp pilus assembly protein TadG
MMRRYNRRPTRRGVAAIELAFVFLLFVIPLMLGIWEVGRLVQVQQIVSNSAREAARLSAQGFTLDVSGNTIQVKTSTGPVNIQNTVYDYLYAAGLTNLQPSDVTVSFVFNSSRTTNYIPFPADPNGTSWPAGSYPTDPCYGDKGEVFTINVSIPWSKVQWINMGLVNPTTVSFTVTWQMLLDDQFTVNDQLPTW